MSVIIKQKNEISSLSALTQFDKSTYSYNRIYSHIVRQPDIVQDKTLVLNLYIKMLSGLKNKAAAAANDAKTLATSSPADSKERASSMAAAATDKAKENAEKYKEKVKEKANEAVDKAKDGAKEFAKKIVHGALDKVSKKIGGAMGSDPDMPKPVKAGLQDIVNALMVEVKADMDAYIDGMAAGKSLEVSEKMLEGQQAVADRTRVRGFARGFCIQCFHTTRAYGQNSKRHRGGL